MGLWDSFKEWVAKEGEAQATPEYWYNTGYFEGKNELTRRQQIDFLIHGNEIFSAYNRGYNAGLNARE